MCGRYVIEHLPDDVNERWQLRQITPDTFPRWENFTTYNAAPTQALPVIVEREDGGRDLLPMQWGLIPRWTHKDGKPHVKPINARSETVFQKPMFRHLTRAKRCVVPASGFYEWWKVGERKQPYFITAHDGELWRFAGLYDDTHNADKDVAGSFTILTTAANPLVAPLHDRMPVILPRDDEDGWLSLDINDPEEVAQYLNPYPEEEMQLFPVSNAVNNTRNNRPELIEPAADDRPSRR